MADALKVVEVVAPYVTVVVTVVSGVATVWLTHRYWFRQFEVQKSYTLVQEKRRLLQRTPQELMRAAQLGQQALVWRILGEILEQVSLEKQSDNGAPIVARQLMQRRRSRAMSRMNALMPALHAERIAARVCFGETAGLAVDAAVKELQSLMATGEDYERLRDRLTSEIRSASGSAFDVGKFVATGSAHISEQLTPRIERFGNFVAQVVQSMAAELEPQRTGIK